MIQFDDLSVEKLIAHKVSSEEGRSIITDTLVECTHEQEVDLLKKLFLKPFQNHAYTFEFKHDIELDYNVLYRLSQKIQAGEDFIGTSGEIAQHLIASSKHPNIKDGELFIAHFDQVLFQGEYVEALGIYKYEQRDHYIETQLEEGDLSLHYRQGLGHRKADKAVLILFTQEPYTLLVIDGKSDTEYWQNEFIKHQPKSDHVNHTNEFLTLTKDYITSQITNDFEVSRADQIDLLNRSVEYFKSNETFDQSDFEQEVFQDENVIKSFRSYDDSYREEHQVDWDDQFEISSQAVKKQARVFKSVLKLDKNFHIYIHGDRQLIEQGVEQDGRKFYKIYYEEEK
jgi:hypothetical protein